MIFWKKGTLTIDRAILERLDREAHRQGRSVPALVQAILGRYLEEVEGAEPRSLPWIDGGGCVIGPTEPGSGGLHPEPLPWIDGGGCVVGLDPEALRSTEAS